MKKNFYFRFLVVAILFLITGKANAQGAGNHFTMSLENCVTTSSNTLQFDLMIVSDGDSTSDLRLNSVAYGINFDTTIAPSGSTFTLSYVTLTSDSGIPYNQFNFLNSTFKNHLRMSESVFIGGNTGMTMIVGHKYRVGTFMITCSANWVTSSNPNFSLQSATAAGRTDCVAEAWIGNSSTITAFDVTGTSDGQRSVSVGCSLTLNCSGCPPVAHFESSDTVFCSQGSNCINFFDRSLGNPTSWRWLFPGASPDSSSQQNPTNICYYVPGTYPVSLIVSNANGTDTLVVSPMITAGNPPNPPTVTLSSDTLVSTSAVYYQWYLNGVPIAGATDSFYVAVQSGTYAVQITDSNQCTSLSNGILVGVCALTISAQVTNATCDTCANGRATANVQNGTPPYTITWYTSPITNGTSVSALLPGTYSVCARDANNCTACTTFFVDSMNCTGYSISTSDSNTTCLSCSDGLGTVVATGGTPPYTYLWSNGYTTSSAHTFSRGTYTVSVTDAIGCLQTKTVTISVGYCKANYNLFADTVPHTYTIINTATGVSPISFLWSWGDGATDTAAYPQHTYASGGFYTICLNITDNVGCTSNYCDSFTLMRMDNNTMIYMTVVPQVITGVINQNSFYQTLKLFPNPANGSVTISYSLPRTSDVKMEVFNSVGQQVEVLSDGLQSAGKQETVFDTQKLPAGIYFVKVTVDGNTTVIKMVKM